MENWKLKHWTLEIRNGTLKFKVCSKPTYRIANIKSQLPNIEPRLSTLKYRSPQLKAQLSHRNHQILPLNSHVSHCESKVASPIPPFSSIKWHLSNLKSQIAQHAYQTSYIKSQITLFKPQAPTPRAQAHVSRTTYPQISCPGPQTPSRISNPTNSPLAPQIAHRI